jgi:uncharacterized protein (DUF4415 family)
MAANRMSRSAWKAGPVVEGDMKRYSAAELERMAALGDYVPTRADAPEIELDEDFWRHARVVVPPGKTSIHLRIDADVLAWFKAHGPRPPDPHERGPAH